MKRHWHRLVSRLAAPAALLAVVLSGASALGDEPATDFFGRPLDMSLDGHRGDWLFNVTTVSVTILFIIMVAIIVTALARHRDSNAAHKAHYDHGIGKKHLMMTAFISSVIFFGVDGTLLVSSFNSLHTAFWKYPTDADKPLKIEVMAQQWGWNIRYPGPDEKFNTRDDVLTFNEMRIPVNRPIYLKLQSKDVIHSFYLPNFRTKTDAIPGTTTRLWFQATKAGAAEIGCAQHCGTMHYKMKGDLHVVSAEEFDAWYKVAAVDAERRYDPNDAEARWGWDWDAN